MQRGAELDRLIARAQDGDVRAFEALLEAHLPLVRRYARAFVAAPQDADDLAQEALLKVYKSLRLFRYQSAFSTWLYAVVRSVFLDAVKSRRHRQSAQEEPLQPLHHAAADAGERPDEQLLRERERQRIWQALRQVPEEFRSALVLFDLEGCSYDEVAAVERVPVGTVKSRLSRGRACLRRLLEGGAVEPAGGPARAGTGEGAPSSHPTGARSG